MNNTTTCVDCGGALPSVTNRRRCVDCSTRHRATRKHTNNAVRNRHAGRTVPLPEQEQKNLYGLAARCTELSAAVRRAIACLRTNRTREALATLEKVERP